MVLGRSPRDPKTLLAGIRDLRSRITLKPVDLCWISEAKKQGRP